MKSHKSLAAVFFSFLAMTALALPSVMTAQPRLMGSEATPAPALAQTRFFITIEGTKQGKFKGEGRGPMNSDKIAGLKFFYEVSAPRDPATGLPTGRRQHRPVVITKEWGAATPQLFEALTNNEVLKSVVFEFFRPTQMGQEQVYQVIKLTNASISNIKQYTDTESTAELEDVAFSFQQIEIQNVPGRTAAIDNWTR
ncbi:MAG TPA: type VI secretion system tube protein TssD [Pyrinomonadaceae bacterium]|nr:type VI secretion system tube protein TssD [Pyrinomonadaceae bacterium]